MLFYSLMKNKIEIKFKFEKSESRIFSSFLSIFFFFFFNQIEKEILFVFFFIFN